VFFHNTHNDHGHDHDHNEDNVRCFNVSNRCLATSVCNFHSIAFQITGSELAALFSYLCVCYMCMV